MYSKETFIRHNRQWTGFGLLTTVCKPLNKKIVAIPFNQVTFMEYFLLSGTELVVREKNGTDSVLPFEELAVQWRR